MTPRKNFAAALAAALLFALMNVPAALAKVVAHVNLTTQRMTVTVNGFPYATWRISSGRRGYYTPRGTWRPKFLKRMHYSRKYDNAPMPFSVFYYGGYAIHGTNAVSRLGRPASHGCIRLSPAAARTFYDLVRQHGRRNTLIRVTGVTPKITYRKRKKKRRYYKRRKRQWSARRVSARAYRARQRVGRRLFISGGGLIDDY
ncbi:MAG TPA: L,D-transpeptidase [Thermopetrobacter sp.]|nr:L,D-transpeptidase [Thermopetrobacter sp.]